MGPERDESKRHSLGSAGGTHSSGSPTYAVFVPAPESAQRLVLQAFGDNHRLLPAKQGDLFITRDGFLPDTAIHRWVSWCGATLSLETRRQYFYEISKFLNFLEELNATWESARDLHFVAYRDSRLLPGGGLTNSRSWAKSSSVIKNFYKYQLAVGTITALPYTVVGSHTALDIRHRSQVLPRRALSMDEWKAFVRHGLQESPEVQGPVPRWPKRDIAAAILMLTTGMRIGELSKLTVMDLRDAEESDGVLELGTISKNQRHRIVRLTPQARRALHVYTRTERHWQATTLRGADHERLLEDDHFLVTKHQGGRITGGSSSGKWSGRASDLPRRLRERAVLIDEDGRFEPAALFLGGSDGSAMSPDGWHKVFRRANQRMQAIDPQWRAIRPHDLRRTFASITVDAVIRTNRASELSDDLSFGAIIARDPVSVAQRALGHASPATTAIYLDSTYRLPPELSSALDDWSLD
ncbi:tyrosine-type recombinase/integrase [Nesterenkonia sp. CF4.4]|uniref:tyrosine-type recombinase/integrase n=1 Tax=Nesterenkonia sp. CF4.4 TaxID=3373079 RepID=UPI003EE50C1B